MRVVFLVLLKRTCCLLFLVEMETRPCSRPLFVLFVHLHLQRVVAATIIAPAAFAELRLRDITHTAAVALQPALPKQVSPTTRIGQWARGLSTTLS